MKTPLHESKGRQTKRIGGGFENDKLEIPNYKNTGKVCMCIDDCGGAPTCELLPKAKCYKVIRIDDYGDVYERAGCLNSEHTHLQQCYGNPNFGEPTSFGCCDNSTMCNKYLKLDLPQTELSPSEIEFNKDQRDVLIGGGIVLGFFFLLVVAIVFAYQYKLKREEKLRRKQIENENKNASCLILTNSNKRGKKFAPYKIDIETSSGWPLTSSGSGFPLLMQRTIANQIKVLHEIGSGRYGTVMLGSWREEYVAVKIFNSTNEDSWQRETEIYQTVLLRHDNILGFIAADICGIESVTKMYLITEYHSNGSLHDYLTNCLVDIPCMLKLVHTAACGLAHLHTEITGTKGKPGIAHRDVKTKNLLVKKDGSCCIADMGLAVKYCRQENKVDLGSSSEVRLGTKRYMSPEVLTKNFDLDLFDAYKRSDVYSFSLVMWEVVNRTMLEYEENRKVPEYKLPYHNVVGTDPSFEEMKKAVALAQIRPQVLEKYNDHTLLSSYCQAMRECWSHRPETRLTMLRVRKTLNNLRNQPNAFNYNQAPTSNTTSFNLMSTTGTSENNKSSTFESLVNTEFVVMADEKKHLNPTQ